MVYIIPNAVEQAAAAGEAAAIRDQLTFICNAFFVTLQKEGYIGKKKKLDKAIIEKLLNSKAGLGDKDGCS